MQVFETSPRLQVHIKFVTGTAHARQFLEWRLKTDRAGRGPGAFRAEEPKGIWESVVEAKLAQLSAETAGPAREEMLKYGAPEDWNANFQLDGLLELWALGDIAVYGGSTDSPARQRIRALGELFNRRGDGGARGIVEPEHVPRDSLR